MGRYNSEDLGVDGKRAFELILERWGGRVWTGLIWLGVGASGVLL
jgi:hypothetical protein